MRTHFLPYLSSKRKNAIIQILKLAYSNVLLGPSSFPWPHSSIPVDLPRHVIFNALAPRTDSAVGVLPSTCFRRAVPD